MGRRANPNTRMGGRPARIGWREISADPNGNREQRRAARKLGAAETPSAPGEPTCPHCGRTSHGFACPVLLGVSEAVPDA